MRDRKRQKETETELKGNREEMKRARFLLTAELKQNDFTADRVLSKSTFSFHYL